MPVDIEFHEYVNCTDLTCAVKHTANAGAQIHIMTSTYMMPVSMALVIPVI